jgi:Sulfotransferase family
MVEHLERALRLRRETIVPVNEPLALICQAQRSGGTLLARLFDGHPQCHAHPHELHIGDRRPHTWPQLELDEKPETWFARLKEDYVSAFFTRGRRQIPLKAPGESTEASYPFVLPPAFQRVLFLEEVERRSPIQSYRQILDCYMTSLFNAWLDNQNLYGPDKRWVVAFSPRRAWGDGLNEFFRVYPEGRLISIIRDPLSWYTSAQGRDPEADGAVLLDSWKRSAGEMLTAKGRYGERVRIIRFDELIMDTPATMRQLADFLGIDFDDQLSTTTFNRYPVGANSSYGVRETGVVTDPVDRYKGLLSEEQQKLIRTECEELYERTIALAGEQPAPSDGVSSEAPSKAPSEAPEVS